MKGHFFRISLFVCIIFSYTTCDPFIIPPPLGLASMGIHLVSIPPCILNEDDLEIKTKAFVNVTNPDGSSSVFDEKVFYSSNATIGGAGNIWNMGLIDVPQSGIYFITIRSKVVIKGSSVCDKPFYPVEDPIDPTQGDIFSNWGCCFATNCCACSDLPYSPHTQHRFTDKTHMLDASSSTASAGQHIRNSLNCFCCAY